MRNRIERFLHYASPVDDQLEAAVVTVDSLLAPFQAALTTPEGAKGMQLTTDAPVLYYRMDLVPCGVTSDWLPIGMQIVGARNEDELVLQAARATKV